jgi:hypothetical protein
MTPVTILRDLMEQTEGEAHCIYQGQVIRARLFYANFHIKNALIRVQRLLPMEGLDLIPFGDKKNNVILNLPYEELPEETD